MKTPLEGGCLCTAVRYRVRSVFDAGYCHCSICRRVHGVPALTWFNVPEQDFELLRGEARGFRSSEFFTRYFCPACGTHVYGTDARPPQPKVGARLVSLAIGTLDEPEEVRPTIHEWYADRVSWFEVKDTLPRVEDGKLPHPTARGR